MNKTNRLLTVLPLVMCLFGWTTARAQEPINLNPGDSIANNTNIPAGTTVNVNGGQIGLGVELIGGELNVNAGQVAIGANSQATGFNNIDNVVNINGGTVGGFFQLRNGTEMNLSGGVVESFGVLTNSTATITGGTVEIFPDIVSGLVNIRGGNVDSVRVFDNGAVNIFGTEFFIDNVLVDDLDVGESRTITARNIDLAATLEDGSPFGFFLNPQIIGFQPDAATFASTVIISRVASPAISPESLDVVTGVLSQGGAASLELSDNADLSVSRNNLSLAAVVEVELSSTSFNSVPSSLDFTVEDSVFARSSISRQIELFDFITGVWEVVDTQNASPKIDSVVTVSPTGDVSRFVEPGTNRVEARLQYTSPVGRAAFTANIDQVVWEFE